MKHLIILIFAFIMAFCDAVFAVPTAVQNNALTFAKNTWGEATIDEGTVYFGRNGEPSVYCFTVALGVETNLSPQAILDQVEKNRKGRQTAEETLRSAIAEQDQEKAAYAHSLINQEWAKMRDEDHFATVYMSVNEEKTEPLQYYKGLPLHYVAIADAQEIGASRLNGHVEIARFLFDGPFAIFVEFKNENETTIVDLLNPDTSEFDVGQVKKAFKPAFQTEPFSYPQFSGRSLAKPSEYCPYSSTQTKISGVPDYQTIHSRGCAPAASGCVLGYWDDNGYSDLVDGGGSGYAGSECTNGYLDLIWCELGPAMYYVVGTGTYISNIGVGIKRVANDTNTYNFSVSNATWFSTPQQDRSIFHNEIDDGYPLVYTMQYYLYGNGAGYHTVAGIGYKIKEYDGPCWDIYYYRIVHDNNTATGTDVYLSEDLIEGDTADTYINTVHPGASKKGAKYASSQPGDYRLALDNYPNPFNPTTTISYSIPNQNPVMLSIYNINAQLVRRFDFGIQEKGKYSVVWDATFSGYVANSGLYFVELNTDAGRLVKKISFIK